MEGRRIYVKHPSYSIKLQHSGTLGMKWGQRLYQNKDGSLTPLGRVHYGIGQARAKRIEKANEKARIKAEAQAAREKARYQNRDGTLNLRGRIKYGTTDKYALLTDDELRKQTNRLQLQKNLEDLKKQNSSLYRLRSKLGNATEEVITSGFKKAAEKIVNTLVDKGVSKLLKTDEDNVKKAREFAESISNMSTSEMQAINKRRAAEKAMYESETGEKLPKDYKYSDLPKKEKDATNSQQNNTSNSKQEASKSSENSNSDSQQKTEVSKSSERKENDQKIDSSEISKIKSKASKGESIKEIAEDTGHSTSTIEKYVNKKVPAMKEVKDNYNEKSSSMKEVSSNPLTRRRMVNEEISGKPYVRVRRVNDETNKKLEEEAYVKMLEDAYKKKKGK